MTMETATVFAGARWLVGISRYSQSVAQRPDKTTLCRPCMELLGTLSNLEIQERLQTLSAKLDRLASSKAKPRRSSRNDRMLRPGTVSKRVTEVLRASNRPMLVQEIHDEVEELLEQPVPMSSVKNWLAKNTGGQDPLFVRLRRGRYRASIRAGTQ